MLPAAAALGAGGIVATLLGFALLGLTISPLCIDGDCGDAGTIGGFAVSIAVLITGGLGIAAAVVGIRYARTGRGAFGTMSAIAIAAAVVVVMLLTTVPR